jgi:hypothetical protein
MELVGDNPTRHVLYNLHSSHWNWGHWEAFYRAEGHREHLITIINNGLDVLGG